METLRIEIVSDPVCPWCYVGKRRLEKALAQRPDLPVELRWSPFQLSPDMPREGVDRAAHYAKIFGEDRARMIMASMAETGREEGLAFQQKPGARSPNTLSAHVLMSWAQAAPDVDSSALAEKLFEAHHVANEDIGDPEVLARLAGEVGMDAGQVLADLRAGKDEETVKRQIQQSVARGVSGVPFFIFNDQYAVSGAQPAEAFVDLFDRLADASVDV
jgi:predicted DsbA family dithiol-disulfide isomerase